MKYLFIDTSNDLNLALADDNHILAYSHLLTKNDCSKYAMVELESIFKQSNLEPNDVDKIFVINGPGSFTGIRIGVTIAKTYAWSLNKEVIPISTLKAYALSNHNYDYYVALLDARRGHVFTAIYDHDYNDILSESYISIDKLNNIINDLNGNIVIIGDIDINEIIKTIPINLDIMSIINYYKNNEPVRAHDLKPNYLKLVEAEEKMGGVVL